MQAITRTIRIRFICRAWEDRLNNLVLGNNTKQETIPSWIVTHRGNLC